MVFGSPQFSGESEHHGEQFTSVEIPLADVPEAIGRNWKSRAAAYLPTGHGENWRDAFTQAFVFTHPGLRQGEALYALVNKSKNPDAGEFVSFAMTDKDEIVNEGLMAFSAKNRPNDDNLPPLYKDIPVAFLLFTHPNRHKGGAGRRVLSAMNAFSLQRYQKPLHSDIERHHLLNAQGERPGWKTWKSLARDGAVEPYETQLGTRYRFVTAKATEVKSDFSAF
jgi:hypothetical protein